MNLFKRLFRRCFGSRRTRTVGLAAYLQDFNSQNWRHYAARNQF